jgi:hypothetical protein
MAGIDNGVEAAAFLDVPLLGIQLLDLCPKALDRILGEAVGEMKGDMLDHVKGVKMGQIAPGMPCGDFSAGTALLRTGW